MVHFEYADHGVRAQNNWKNTKTEEGLQNGVDLNSTTNTENSYGIAFKQLNCLSSKVQKLFGDLQKMTKKEEELGINLNLPSNSNGDCVAVSDRDSAVTSIKSLQRFYNYGNDTLAAAVCYMDRFLAKVKVKSRYMSCIAAASFFLASKMNEEVETHPSASELSSLHRHTWKPSDLKRMEKVILDKLDWDLYPAVSSFSFIQLIYRLLNTINFGIDEQMLAEFEEQAELCINYSQCARYRASTLALALVHHCLKESSHSSVITNYLLLHVQAVCKISDSELLDCQCTISRQLELYNIQPASRPLCLPLPRITPRLSLVFKPSIYGNTDLPTIEEDPWDSDSSEEEEEPAKTGVHKNPLPSLYSEVVRNGAALRQLEPKVMPGRCLLSNTCFSGNIGAFCSNSLCNIVKS